MTCMALSCGMAPDHSTIAAVVSSMPEEMISLFRDGLRVCAAQGWFGGTHVALAGLQLSSKAAKAWSGTCDDLRQKQENLAAKVQSLLEAHARADQDGATASLAESRDEPVKMPEQIERREKQAARIEHFLAQSAPRRGTRGQELQRNVTANDSANMQPAHGVMQGDKAQARVDSQQQVIVHAEALGHGQDDGHGAPMVAGATATMQALGLPADYCEGRLFRADSNSHREGNVKTWAGEKLAASMPDPHFRAREPRLAT
jgi:hypothetical protein